MTAKKLLERLIKKIDHLGNYSIYLDYSGRGMFGKKCIGLVCDDSVLIVEEAARKGLCGARIDDLGRRTIVYWPDFQENTEVKAPAN